MGETKFTPGPWSADPDHEPGMEWNWHIVRANAPHLRVCFMAKSDRSEANAHLIAAAPELYEALVDALASLNAAISLLERGGKKAAPSDMMFDQMMRDYSASFDRGRAIAAKARGETP